MYVDQAGLFLYSAGVRNMFHQVWHTTINFCLPDLYFNPVLHRPLRRGHNSLMITNSTASDAKVSPWTHAPSGREGNYYRPTLQSFADRNHE